MSGPLSGYRVIEIAGIGPGPFAAMTRDIFLGPDGKPDADKSRNSAFGIGVPGTVAGLALALEKYGSGKFTLGQVLQPAIALARDGFVVADDMADTLPDMYRRMARWPNSASMPRACASCETESALM